MLKSPKNRNKNAAPAPAPAAPNRPPVSNPPHAPAPKLVAVIKNNLTEQEMNASGEHWANHKGPYMTVAETLAYAAARAMLRPAVEQTQALSRISSKAKLVAARSAYLVLQAWEEKRPGISHRRRL